MRTVRGFNIFPRKKKNYKSQTILRGVGVFPVRHVLEEKTGDEQAPKQFSKISKSVFRVQNLKSCFIAYTAYSRRSLPLHNNAFPLV